MGFFTDAGKFLKENKDLVNAGSNLASAGLAYLGGGKAADATLAAANRAAEMGEFRPFTITSGFGTSYFDTSGQRAGYELDPRLAAFRDALYGGAVEAGSFDMDPTKASQDYYNRMQGLMEDSRKQEDIKLRASQLASGRLGLGLSGVSQGAGEGTGYVNPEQYQRDLARAKQDQQLAVASQDYAQAGIDRNIARSLGLMQAGLGLEEYGLKPLQIGADIGNKAATLGDNQGTTLLTGATSAAQTNLARTLGAANFLSNASRTGTGYKFDPYTGKPVA